MFLKSMQLPTDTVHSYVGDEQHAEITSAFASARSSLASSLISSEFALTTAILEPNHFLSLPPRPLTTMTVYCGLGKRVPSSYKLIAYRSCIVFVHRSAYYAVSN